MTLYSNRRQPMFEIVEDTVGRHDMLYACCDPVRYEMLGAPGHANCREALTEALSGYGIGYDRIPTPINWFMNVSILQRGELEIREPLAEAGDYVLLRALKDVVAAVSACPQDLDRDQRVPIRPISASVSTATSRCRRQLKDAADAAAAEPSAEEAEAESAHSARRREQAPSRAPSGAPGRARRQRRRGDCGRSCRCARRRIGQSAWTAGTPGGHREATVIRVEPGE